jgi:hypothetical protein
MLGFTVALPFALGFSEKCGRYTRAPLQKIACIDVVPSLAALFATKMRLSIIRRRLPDCPLTSDLLD